MVLPACICGHVAAQRDCGCGLGSKTKRDASTTRECVSHLQEKGNGRHCQDI